MADNLGTYKVVVRADYEQFQRDIQSINASMIELTKNIMDAMKVVSDDIRLTSESITTSMNTSIEGISKSLSGLETSAGNVSKNIKGSFKEIGDGLDGLKKQTDEVGKGFSESSKQSDGLGESYRKQGKAAKTLEGQIRQLRNAAQQAFQNNDSAGTNELTAKADKLKDALGSFNKIFDKNKSEAKEAETACKQLVRAVEQFNIAEKSQAELTARSFYTMQTNANKALNTLNQLGYKLENLHLPKALFGSYGDYDAPFEKMKQEAEVQKQIQREAEQAARAQQRASEQAARAQQRAAEQAARAQQREAEQVARAQQVAERQRLSAIASAQRRYDELYNSINDHIVTNTRMSELFFQTQTRHMNELRAQMQSLGATNLSSLKNFDNFDLSRFNSQFEVAKKKVNALQDAVVSLKHHMTWLASAAFMGGLIGLPKVISDAYESFDTLQTKITQNMELAEKYRNNTELLQTDVKRMGDAARTYAQSFGVGVDEAQNAMQVLTRRFKDANTAIYLTGVALTMSKLDFVDTQKSARDLEAVMLQFGLGAKDAGKFLNEFSIICHTARINGTDLLDALERSGSAFHAAGMGAKEAMAAIATLSTVTARTGANIGESWKSMLANLDFKKATKALSAYNIELYKTQADGTKVMRGGAEVFRDVMNVYQQLDDKGRRSLAIALAGGKYQVNSMLSFLSDASGSFNKFMKDMDGASDEKTMELLAKSLHTYQTGLAQMKAAAQNLAIEIGTHLSGAFATLTSAGVVTLNVLKNNVGIFLAIAKAVSVLIGSFVALKAATLALRAPFIIFGALQGAKAGFGAAVMGMVKAFKQLGGVVGKAIAPIYRFMAARVALTRMTLATHGLIGVMKLLLAQTVKNTLVAVRFRAVQFASMALMGVLAGLYYAQAAALAVLNGVKVVAAVIQGILNVYHEQGAVAMLKYVGSMIASAAATGIMTAATALLDGALLPVIGTVMAVIAVLALLVGAIAYLYENWSSVSEELVTAWNTAVDFIAQAAQVLLTVIAVVMAGIAIALAPVFATLYVLGNIVKFVFETIVIPIFRFFWKVVSWVLEKVAQALGIHANREQSIAQNIHNTWTWLLNVIRQFAPGFASFLDHTLGYLVDFAEKVAEIASKVASAIHSMLTLGKDNSDGGISGLMNTFQEARDNITNAGIDTMNTIQNDGSLDAGGYGDGGSMPTGSMPDEIGDGGGGGGSKGSKGSKGKTGKASTGKKVKTTEEKIWDFFIKKGYNPEFVAGLMGNISVETGDTYDPYSTSPDGLHKGIGQWGDGVDGDRWGQYTSWAAQNGYDPWKLENQLAWIDHELHDSYAGAYSTIMNQGYTTPEQYARGIQEYYEGAPGQATDQREEKARDITNKNYGSTGNEDFIDPVEQKKKDFQTQYKIFESRTAQLKAQREASGYAWTDNDTLAVYNSIMGDEGSNIDLTSVGSDLGSAIAAQAESEYDAHPGAQWVASRDAKYKEDDYAHNSTGIDDPNGTARTAAQCASFVSDVFAQVLNNSSDLNSANVDVLTNQAGSAYHSLGSGYTPKRGDVIIWGTHAGIYMGDDTYIARNSGGGIHKGSVSQDDWFGGLEGYISTAQLPKAATFSGTGSGSSTYASLEEYQKKRADLIKNANKYNADYRVALENYNYEKEQATPAWIHEIEKIVNNAVANGQRLSDKYLKIYQSMMKSSTLGAGGKDKLTEDANRYKEEAALRKTMLDSIKKSAESHTKAIDDMASKEREFAKKLGLLTEDDIRRNAWHDNERDFARKRPLADAKLIETAQKGKELDMIGEYRNFFNSQTEEEAKVHLQKIMDDSKDVESTSKALEEMLKLYEEYYKKRQELGEQQFEKTHEYIIGIKDAFVDSFKEAFKDTINRTKSFSENMQSIFKAMWDKVLDIFTNNMGERLNQIISQAVFGNKPDGYAAGAYQGYEDRAKKPAPSFGYGATAAETAGKLIKRSGSKYPSKNDQARQVFGIEPMDINFGIGSSVSAMVASSRKTFTTFQQSGIKAANAVKSTMTQTFSTMQQGAVQATTNMGQAFVTNYATTATTSSKAVAASVSKDGQQVQTNVIANIGAMVAQMLAAMAIMAALSGIFGGGGTHTSTSTSSENLGRSPDSYYMTPTAVLQSTTIPSMDIGGNIEKDMLIYAHKNEMVLTPAQAGVIRDMAQNRGNTQGGNGGYTGNANVHSNITVSTVDSKGFDRVLKNYNRDLSKRVKQGIRNGYLDAKGLV